MSQVVEADEGLVSQAGERAGGPIEHPLGQFERPAQLVVLEPAMEHGEMTSPDPLDDDHPTAEPGMPGVMDLAGLGTVGLLSRDCTIESGAIRRSGTCHRPSTREPDEPLCRRPPSVGKSTGGVPA